MFRSDGRVEGSSNYVNMLRSRLDCCGYKRRTYLPIRSSNGCTDSIVDEYRQKTNHLGRCTSSRTVPLGQSVEYLCRRYCLSVGCQSHERGEFEQTETYLSCRKHVPGKDTECIHVSSQAKRMYSKRRANEFSVCVLCSG